MVFVGQLVSREQEGDEQEKRMPERRTAKDRRQHLYLVFDDLVSGYTIRKVRLTPGSLKRSEQPLSPVSGEDSGDGDGEGAKHTLPGVFMSVEALRRSAMHFTSAFGTKIVALHPGESDMGYPILDVKDKSCIFGPVHFYAACPIFFPIGVDRFFTLDVCRFNVCNWTPGQSEPWVWQDLPYPPFQRHDVSSYAVQPDGCILVSTRSGTTCIFDAKECVWKQYGDWALPFTGRAHYDPSLEAFVGLSIDSPEALGYLSGCSMDRTGTGNRRLPPPICRRSKEKVYNESPAEKHVSATLVHMRRGKFCLVEYVSIDDVRADQELMDPEIAGVRPQGGRFMYRLKIFSLSMT